MPRRRRGTGSSTPRPTPTSTHPDLAPLRSDRLHTLPPTLVVTAEHDPLRDEGERLAGGSPRLGVDVVGTRYLGQVHGFWRHPQVFPPAEPLTRQVAGFLRTPRSERMPPMRVHLGSDHAGLDLKDHLLAWLADHGYEPVDHGPFVYDAARRLPGLLPAGRRGRGRRPGRGLDSLGVVIGGSGNGEQMAANKVAGIRCALVWSEETAVLAREHNDANVVSVGGRMHSLDEMTRFVEVFLDHAVHRARSGTCAGSASSPTYETTGELPPLPESARRPAPGRPMPEGHTLHRLADELDRGVRRPAGPGRAARRAGSRTSAALLDGARAASAPRRAGKHLFVDVRRRPVRARPPRPLRPFDVHAGVDRRAAAGRPGPAAAGRRRRRRTAYADLRGATTCDLVTPRAARRRRRAARARPAPRRRRPGARLGSGSAAAGRRSATC